MTFTNIPCLCGWPASYLVKDNNGFHVHCYHCGKRRKVTAEGFREEYKKANGPDQTGNGPAPSHHFASIN